MESVNRMKLRNLGGCRLFVNVLNDPTRASLHDRVINSLLQFTYDNQSLNVLMNEGLVPSLVTFLEDHTEREGRVHCCDKVEEKPKLEDEVVEEEEEKEATKDSEDNVESDTGDPAAGTAAGVEVSQAEDSNDKAPVFRVTSPSYQAVQHELEKFLLLRSSRSLEPSSLTDWSPVSPGSSYCQSPDRSPLSLSCGFSPDSSPRSFYNSPTSASPDHPSLFSDYSPPSSPPYSPPEPMYSPIENFSDEEQDDSATPAKEEDQSPHPSSSSCTPSSSTSSNPSSSHKPFSVSSNPSSPQQASSSMSPNP